MARALEIPESISAKKRVSAFTPRNARDAVGVKNNGSSITVDLNNLSLLDAATKNRMLLEARAIIQSNVDRYRKLVEKYSDQVQKYKKKGDMKRANRADDTQSYYEEKLKVFEQALSSPTDTLIKEYYSGYTQQYANYKGQEEKAYQRSKEIQLQQSQKYYVELQKSRPDLKLLVDKNYNIIGVESKELGQTLSVENYNAIVKAQAEQQKKVAEQTMVKIQTPKSDHPLLVNITPKVTSPLLDRFSQGQKVSTPIPIYLTVDEAKKKYGFSPLPLDVKIISEEEKVEYDKYLKNVAAEKQKEMEKKGVIPSFGTTILPNPILIDSNFKISKQDVSVGSGISLSLPKTAPLSGFQFNTFQPSTKLVGERTSEFIYGQQIGRNVNEMFSNTFSMNQFGTINTLGTKTMEYGSILSGLQTRPSPTPIRDIEAALVPTRRLALSYYLPDSNTRKEFIKSLDYLSFDRLSQLSKESLILYRQELEEYNRLVNKYDAENITQPELDKLNNLSVRLKTGVVRGSDFIRQNVTSGPLKTAFNVGLVLPDAFYQTTKGILAFQLLGMGASSLSIAKPVAKQAVGSKLVSSAVGIGITGAGATFSGIREFKQSDDIESALSVGIGTGLALGTNLIITPLVNAAAQKKLLEKEFKSIANLKVSTDIGNVVKVSPNVYQRVSTTLRVTDNFRMEQKTILLFDKIGKVGVVRTGSVYTVISDSSGKIIASRVDNILAGYSKQGKAIVEMYIPGLGNIENEILRGKVVIGKIFIRDSAGKITEVPFQNILVEQNKKFAVSLSQQYLDFYYQRGAGEFRNYLTKTSTFKPDTTVITSIGKDYGKGYTSFKYEGDKSTALLSKLATSKDGQILFPTVFQAPSLSSSELLSKLATGKGGAVSFPPTVTPSKPIIPKISPVTPDGFSRLSGDTLMYINGGVRPSVIIPSPQLFGGATSAYVPDFKLVSPLVSPSLPLTLTSASQIIAPVSQRIYTVPKYNFLDALKIDSKLLVDSDLKFKQQFDQKQLLLETKTDVKRKLIDVKPKTMQQYKFDLKLNYLQPEPQTRTRTKVETKQKIQPKILNLSFPPFSPVLPTIKQPTPITPTGFGFPLNFDFGSEWSRRRKIKGKEEEDLLGMPTLFQSQLLGERRIRKQRVFTGLELLR